MKNKSALARKLSRSFASVLALALATTGSALNAQNPTYKVIHQLAGAGGYYPSGSPVFDAAGNLYGVNSFGGRNTRNCSGCGSVFKLSKNSAGQWTQTALYRFAGGTTDGVQPQGSLVIDSAGNLYGTTYGGGLYQAGTVFELSPTSTGGLQETILYSFRGFGTGDGVSPAAGLLLDAAGNLYGTTSFGGGTGSIGTAFKLSPSSGGTWTETVLHSFTGSDGYGPQSNLIMDSTGSLYGTTIGGGAGTSCGAGNGCGTVFKLSPDSSGGWTESVLHSFDFHDGSNPSGGLVFDASGNLYGMTTWGVNTVACNVGSNTGCGVVYKVSPNGSGGWNYTGVVDFNNHNGAYPIGNLIVDASGNLLGCTFNGGNASFPFGIAFRLSPNGRGGWTESVMHAFSAAGTAGGGPLGVTMDSSGNLFGMTEYGGSGGTGLVFELTP
jgi:uncharacterized repeat protein (TIGR03803 family)